MCALCAKVTNTNPSLNDSGHHQGHTHTHTHAHTAAAAAKFSPPDTGIPDTFQAASDVCDTVSETTSNHIESPNTLSSTNEKRSLTHRCVSTAIRIPCSIRDERRHVSDGSSRWFAAMIVFACHFKVLGHGRAWLCYFQFCWADTHRIRGQTASAMLQAQPKLQTHTQQLRTHLLRFATR